MRLVTISAPYGAGGSVIAPAVADRLELPNLTLGGVDAALPLDDLVSEEAFVTETERVGTRSPTGARW